MQAHPGILTTLREDLSSLTSTVVAHPDKSRRALEKIVCSQYYVDRSAGASMSFGLYEGVAGVGIGRAFFVSEASMCLSSMWSASVGFNGSPSGRGSVGYP